MEEEAKAAAPVYLKYFEDILRSNNGGKGFFVGDKVRGKKTIFEPIDLYLLSPGGDTSINKLIGMCRRKGCGS